MCGEHHCALVTNVLGVWFRFVYFTRCRCRCSAFCCRRTPRAAHTAHAVHSTLHALSLSLSLLSLSLSLSTLRLSVRPSIRPSLHPFVLPSVSLVRAGRRRYTFGYLFALGVFAQQEAPSAAGAGSEAGGFHRRYVALLRDTGRMTAEELVMTHLGVDISEPIFWTQSCAIVGRKLDAFEAAIDELGL